jgi:hypothetical protein
MTKIRLHYFDVRGRAEGIRKLLHYKNIPYEMVIYNHEEWPAKKNGEFLKRRICVFRNFAVYYTLFGSW